jgi:hypothetical protein
MSDAALQISIRGNKNVTRNHPMPRSLGLTSKLGVFQTSHYLILSTNSSTGDGAEVEPR